MSFNASNIYMKSEVRLKGIALPIEHGSWGFLFEPLLAGLLIAPSFAAIWNSLLIIGAFLMRQPLKVWLTDLKAQKKLPQTAAAIKFTFIYGIIFLVGLTGSLYFVKLNSFLPFLLISPLVIYQIYCDASRQSRNLLPEITGAIAISSSIAVIALADNRTFISSFALWLIFIARLISSIIYVRNRLRLEKGKEYSFITNFLTNLMAVLFIGYLTFVGLSSILTLLMFLILFGRSIWGLSPYRKKVKAMKIGIWEVIYGTLTALSVVFGYYLQI